MRSALTRGRSLLHGVGMKVVAPCSAFSDTTLGWVAGRVVWGTQFQPGHENGWTTELPMAFAD